MNGICEPIRILDIGHYSIRGDGEVACVFSDQYPRLLNGSGAEVANPGYATAAYIDVWLDDLGNVRNSAGQAIDPPPRFSQFTQRDWASSEF